MRLKRFVRAIVFDMDGTLFDSLEVVPAAYIECVAYAGGPTLSTTDVVAAYSLGPPGTMLTHLLGRTSTAEDLDSYHRCLEQRSVALRPYDGIVEALVALRSARPLAVFTGASREACRILCSAAGVDGDFDLIVGGDEIEHPKPAPDGLQLACARLGVSPAETIYVGDSPIDMETASAAGCIAAAAGWGHMFSRDVRADVLLATPRDLAHLVEP